MKNILFILHFPPPVHGSSIVGQSIKNSPLINNSFDCRYINLLLSSTISETGKKSLSKVLRFVAVWFKLLVEIIKKKPDICYLALTTTGNAFYKDVLLVGLLRLFGVKRIYHLHNKGIRRSQSKTLNFLLYRFVFRNASVILLSKHLYNDIETFVPNSLIFTCPNGIAKLTTNDNTQLLRTSQNVKILFLSNLLEAKGVYVLLEACSILQQKGIDFECNFVGAEGDLNAAQFHEEVIQKRLSLNVNYWGEKFGKEKEEIFAAADIFVHPTSNDCFPLVLLEAMCASLPVISTFEGGIPDIVEDGITGYLVSQKNAEALADKLEVLIKNSELRKKMGKAGREKYEMEFTMDKFECRFREILQEVIGE